MISPTLFSTWPSPQRATIGSFAPETSTIPGHTRRARTSRGHSRAITFATTSSRFTDSTPPSRRCNTAAFTASRSAVERSPVTCTICTGRLITNISATNPAPTHANSITASTRRPVGIRLLTFIVASQPLRNRIDVARPLHDDDVTVFDDVREQRERLVGIRRVNRVDEATLADSLAQRMAVGA